MKAIIIICDGMADRPHAELGKKTPLEIAKTGNMDTLARKGETGILDPIAPGIRAGTDTSHLAILGYDPKESYTGRGPLEAAGIGLDILEGDIAIRCNFATVDDNLIVRDRRAGRINEGTEELAKAVNEISLDGADFVFKESTAHRAALVLRGSGLGCGVSESDPHTEGRKVMPITPLDGSQKSKKTARILNEFSKRSHEVLNEHPINKKRAASGKPPANMLLLRGVGEYPRLTSFEEKYKLKSGCMATTGIVKGIAKLLCMDILEPVPEYDLRIKNVVRYMDDYDFILVNIKEADEAAHDHNPGEKVEIIEKIDAAVSPLIEFSKENYVALLSDHTTPSNLGDHSGDPVPLVICGPEVRTDDITEFNERACSRGGINRIKGTDLMPILMNLMNRAEKYGA